MRRSRLRKQLESALAKHVEELSKGGKTPLDSKHIQNSIRVLTKALKAIR